MDPTSGRSGSIRGSSIQVERSVGSARAGEDAFWGGCSSSIGTWNPFAVSFLAISSTLYLANSMGSLANPRFRLMLMRWCG